jgi:hypothetical protein
MRVDSKKGFAKMDKTDNVENRIMVEMINLNSTEVEKTTKEIRT